MNRRVILFVALLSFALSLGTAKCSDTKSGWEEIGIRMGIQAAPKNEYFHRYDVFAVYKLPWDWRSPSGWGVAPQLETSLGALYTSAETGFISSVGAGLTFGKTGFNLTPELGVGLHLMDRSHFGKQDFGSILLWEAHLGLSYRFDCGLGIGYRIQHMSNNRILYSSNTPNPGVDMHMISVSWHF